MPRLLKNISFEIIEENSTIISGLKNVETQIGLEDYVKVFSFTGFLQNFTKVKNSETLTDIKHKGFTFNSRSTFTDLNSDLTKTYHERVYIQNNHPALRNKTNIGPTTSGDFCQFTQPIFSISGADKIMSATTASTSVYLLTNETDIDLTFNFSGDLATNVNNLGLVFEIFKYDVGKSVFVTPQVYKSDVIPYSGFSASSAYTVSVPLTIIPPDNEYLVKTYFNFGACTEILSELGETYSNRNLIGDQWGMYDDEFDYYLSLSYSAETPYFGISTAQTNISYGNLIAYSQFPSVNGQTEYFLANYVGDVMVNLNGVTLSENFDYSISGNIVTLIGETYVDKDVLTFIHCNGVSTLNGLTNDLIQVSTISSGVTDTQGNNKVFYNTTQNKYEIYTVNLISPNSDVVVTLNGATLANNIDYYRSTSNEQRIILNGVILPNDVINIYYYSQGSFIGNVYTNTPLITWYINNAPQLNNGNFIIEVSTGTSFTNFSYTSETEYIVGETIYYDNIVVSGDVGTNYYYRVKNEKYYQPITGDTIDTVAYSEIIPITIQTNSVNSY